MERGKKRLGIIFLLAIFLVGVVSAVPTTSSAITITSAADRLVALQDSSGSWDWVVTNAVAPTGTTNLNIAGITAEGLLDAYKLTGNSNYLSAAKKTGDYIVNKYGSESSSDWLGTDHSTRIVADNVLFLYDLGKVTGNSQYTSEATTLMNALMNSRSAADELTYVKTDRGATTTPDGIVFWDLMNYVEDAKLAGNNGWANDLVSAVNSQISGTNPYFTISNNQISDYVIGLSGIITITGNSNAIQALKTAQNQQDGSWSDDDGQVQDTAYAIMALMGVGDVNDAKNGASWLENNQINTAGGLTKIGGWYDSTAGNNNEVSEVDSEAIQALYNYAPFVLQSQASVTTTANTPTSVTTTGTDAGIILTTPSGQSGTVTVQQSGGNSFSGLGVVSLGKFISIISTIPDSAISNVEIRIHYTNADLASSHVVESSLKLYYYNTIAGAWQVVVPSGVNVTGKYVWGITNHFSTYTLGGGSGPAVSINGNVCGGYTNNVSTIFFGSAFDSSGQTINLVAYNRSDDPLGSPVHNAALVPPLSNNVSFNTQVFDPAFPAGNNSIFFWASSNQTGPITVCSFLVDTQAPNPIPVQVNGTSVILANPSACVPNYVNVAPQFSWLAATDVGGSGINHYDVELFQKSLLLSTTNVGNVLTFTVPTPINGDNYYVQVRAVDNAGNAGAYSPLSTIVYYDTGLPTATINLPLAGTFFNNDFQVSETDSDPEGNLNQCFYKIINNAGAPTPDFTLAPCNQNVTVDLSANCPADGTCNVSKKVVDKACNSFVTSKVYNIDTTAPTTSKIVSAPSVTLNGPFGAYTLLSYFLRNTTTISLSCSDTGSGCPILGATKYQIVYPDGTNSGLLTYSTPFTLSHGDGFYNVSYYSTDVAGNIELLKSEIDNVDTLAPITIKTIGHPMFIDATNKTWVTNTTQFILNCTDSGVGCANINYQINGAMVSASPAAVNLGTAGNFEILSYAGITDSPTSVITGNIGVTPTSGTSIGVTCPEVTGTIYSVDAAGPSCKVTSPTLLGTALGDLTAAYNDALSRPTGVLNTGNGAGEIGGQTLAPGVYTFTGASINVLISTPLTLSGGANDVWIFQIPGTFNVHANVILGGGAQAKNIFWVVAGATTIFPGVTVNGNILDHTSIAMQSLATLNGRALSQTASVTLIANTLTSPGTASVGTPSLSKTFSLSLGGQNNVSYWSIDQLGNIETSKNETDYVDTTFPIITVHNPTPTEASNVSGCVQAVVVEASDLGSGVNDNSLRAVLLNSTGVFENLTLKKSVYGTYETLMDKELPAGIYTLNVYAADNLGHQTVTPITENLTNSVFVQFVSPATCNIDPTLGGSCSFTFNVCMRGADAMQFWMNKLGSLVTPDMMGATISSNSSTAFVGFSDGTTFLNPVNNSGMLRLSPSIINGRTSFNLQLTLNSTVVQSIGPGVHDLQYYINSSSI
jgi:hypothetical protein